MKCSRDKMADETVVWVLTVPNESSPWSHRFAVFSSPDKAKEALPEAPRWLEQTYGRGESWLCPELHALIERRVIDQVLAGQE